MKPCKKPVNPKPKEYKDYLNDLVIRGEITQEEAEQYINQCKSKILMRNDWNRKYNDL